MSFYIELVPVESWRDWLVAIMPDGAVATDVYYKKHVLFKL